MRGGRHRCARWFEKEKTGENPYEMRETPLAWSTRNQKPGYPNNGTRSMLLPHKVPNCSTGKAMKEKIQERFGEKKKIVIRITGAAKNGGKFQVSVGITPLQRE